MHNIHHRLWIAISVSTLAIVSSHPAVAKPQPKVVVSSAIESKAVATDNNISPQPVDAILDNLKRKPSTPPKKIGGIPPQRQLVNRKSIAKAPNFSRVKKVSPHITADRSFEGIAELVNSRQVPSSVDNFSAVNRLIE
jgi:hypothetical protein